MAQGLSLLLWLYICCKILLMFERTKNKQKGPRVPHFNDFFDYTFHCQYCSVDLTKEEICCYLYVVKRLYPI